MSGSSTYKSDRNDVPQFPLGCVAVTPSDSTDLSIAYPDGVVPFVTVAGNLSVVDMLGNTVDLLAVPAFTIIPWRCSKVRSTGTAATVRAIV